MGLVQAQTEVKAIWLVQAQTEFKAQAGLDLNRSNAAIRKSSRGRILVVEGYDTRIPEDAIKSALKKHFASCGEIRQVMIPRVVGSDILHRFAVIDILVEEGAEDKALELSGSDVGGGKVFVKAYPCMKQNDSKLALTRMKVTVYGTRLSKDGIESALRKHFSSCGEVSSLVILGDDDGSSTGLSSRCAFLTILGEGERGGDGAVEEAKKLSGCDVGGLEIIVNRVFPHPDTIYNVSWGSPIPGLDEAEMATDGVES